MQTLPATFKESTCVKINAFLLSFYYRSQMIVCSATLHSFEVKKLAVSYVFSNDLDSRS